MSLSREQILASRKERSKPQRLEVPEWGGEVFVKVLSAEDQMSFGEGDPKTMTGRVLVAALVDEEGERIFTDDDVAELMREEAPVIMRVFSVAAKVNGLTTTELDEAMERFVRAPDEQRASA
jgi:hypothetical protein